MGRTLPVPVPCQVCGDKSYGRHYGIFCCDGCSCFFKRSIRKNISYTCISGDNKCVVDKARRNWCPSCRLQKCYTVKMIRSAVQDERGPRKAKGDKARPEQATRQKSSQKREKYSVPSRSSQSEEICKQLLLRCLQESLQGPVLKFASSATKREVLETRWHGIFLLCAAISQPVILDSMLGRETPIREILKFVENMNLDPQETHLASCLLLCFSPGEGLEMNVQLRDLGDLYRLMLVNHCGTVHPEDPLRSAKLLYLLTTLVSVQPHLIHEAVFPNKNKSGIRVGDLIVRICDIL